ncbi:MAG: co-chaperone HscB, partial [Variovorax sp.]
DVNALAALDAELADTRRAQLDDIGGALDAQQYDKAALGVRQLMFLEKFGDEVAAAFDRMTD